MIYTIAEIQVAAGYATAELPALHSVSVPEFWAALEKGLAAARENEETPHPNEPYLGLATTRQIIDELECRCRMADDYTDEKWPSYRTVDAS